MAWTIEWRTKGDQTDAVFVLDERGAVRQAIPASRPVLSRMLTDMGDIVSWQGEGAVEGETNDPPTWGQLVISRASSGEVLEVEPELFWHGIYVWFRSHGIDYDTPGQENAHLIPGMSRPSKAVLMDD